MQFSVATNFDDALIEGLKDYPVREVYGKLPRDAVGGGRSSYMLAPLSKRRLAEHVHRVKASGMRFNYLLNAACMDNKEITRQGQRQIRKLLDWICEIGAEAVTVANPLLLKLIKQHYAQLYVRISVFAAIDHLRKAKFWEALGADELCLDSLTVNRDFEALRSLRGALSCDLELLANNNCLMSCPMSQTHMNLLAMSSQAGHKSGGFVVDYCMLECSKMKLQDPVNYIRSDWIRPEDLHIYEAMGYDRFKLVERNLPTSVMLRRVKAYATRHFEGNLLDLIQPYGFKDKQRFNAHRWLHRFSFLFRPRKINPLKLRTFFELCKKKGMLSSIDEAPVIIDNRKLDGFLDRWIKQNCREVDCEQCRYCHDYADRAVRIHAPYRQDCLSLHDHIDQNIVSGNLWSYGRKSMKSPEPSASVSEGACL